MLKAFAFPRYAVAAIILLGMGAISAGIMNSVEDNGSAQPQPAHVANVQEEIARLEGGPPVDEVIPIRVSGRVLQPDGQPCARASLYMGLAERGARPDGEHPRHTTFPLRATTGADGRFQFAFTRSQLNMAPLENAHPALMAVAKGYGFGWTVIPDWQTEARANIQLVDDRPVGGRIVDGEGNPVANLKVKIFDVAGTGILMWKGTIPELPEMIRTDADGRFRLPGVGFNRVVGGTVEGANIVTSGFMAIAGIVEMKQIAYAGFTVKGAVRDRKTKLPIPEVALSWQSGGRSTLTDAKGNYELRYRKSDGHQQCIFLYPQTGLHFSAGMHLPLNVSADTVRLDFELDSGIVLTGKVTNVAKGKPPSAATVTYHPLPSNTSALPGGISSALVRPDGAYTLAVRPGPGLVCVAAAPRDAYALAVMDRQAIDKANGEPVTMEKRDIVSSAPYYYKLSLSENNLIVPINPDEKTQSMTLNLPLQAASHVQGMVIGPDGKPQEDVECCGLNALPRKVDIIKDGSFTVLGLNGQTQKDLYFRQAKRNLGRVYHLPGNAREPVQIELYPLGNISGRLLDPAGKPVANWPVFLHHQVEHNDIVDLLLSPTFTDPDGAFREEVLPEVKYKVEYDRRICRLANDPGEIEVRPNETKDLGDLIMAAAPKPPAK
jgi:protocatechuate 3,4-dioxygenase beta subunit